MAHYLIINTGGTIGMVEGPNGLSPRAGEIEAAMNGKIEVLNGWQNHQLSWDHWNPLLDSSELQPEHWLRLKESIVSNTKCDGVLVIHGTDTLSYTAAALSFLLTGLEIPVVITGSMLPISVKGTDAIDNLILALSALEQKIPEVVVAVGKTLLPGSRASKTSTASFNAFEAPGWPTEKWSVEINKTPLANFNRFNETDIAIFTLYPGVNARLLKQQISQKPSAIIINAFGNGNCASREDFQQALLEAKERNIPIFVTSQCVEANVDFSIYAAGEAFQKAGAISCGTMPFEATLTKLLILFSIHTQADDVVSHFQKPISREWQ